MRNKFDSLGATLPSHVDIVLISETKTDFSFSTAQYEIDGYTTYKLDRNTNGGGVFLYVKEDVPSTLLSTELFIEGLCI